MHDLTEQSAHISPQRYARAGAILYLAVFALGFTLFAYPHISASGNATVTARSLLAAAPALHVISAAELVNFWLDVPLAVILYALLAPVDANISLLAAFFRLGNGLIGGLIGVSRLAVVGLFSDAAYRNAFTPDQLQALAALASATHGYGIDIAFTFFGSHCIVLGYLLYRSTYLPKFLGVLMCVAGVIYLGDSLADIAAPSVAARIPDAIFLVGFAAELTLCVWLLVRGVNRTKWQAAVGTKS